MGHKVTVRGSWVKVTATLQGPTQKTAVIVLYNRVSLKLQFQLNAKRIRLNEV